MGPCQCLFPGAHAKFQGGVMGVEGFKRISRNIVGTRLQRFRAVSRVPEKDHQCAKITSFTWGSSRLQKYFAFGTKIGGVVVRDVKSLYAREKLIAQKDVFEGGVAGIDFDPFTASSLILLSTNGCVVRWDFEKNAFEKLLDPGLEMDDFGCLTLSHCRSGLIAVGNAHGDVTLMDRKSGKVPVAKRKIHYSRVKSVEFSDALPELLATASLDKTAKLWDIRMLAEDSSSGPLNVFPHREPVASARFSKTNSCCLMTTDVESNIAAFSIPTSVLINSITDKLQHSVYDPAVASWHPLTDLIVTGGFTRKWQAPIVVKFWDPFSKPTGPRILVEGRLKGNVIGRRVKFIEFSRDGEALAVVSEQSVSLLQYEDAEGDRGFRRKRWKRKAV